VRRAMKRRTLDAMAAASTAHPPCVPEGRR
jgi:hypothetical protein